MCVCVCECMSTESPYATRRRIIECRRTVSLLLAPHADDGRQYEHALSYSVSTFAVRPINLMIVGGGVWWKVANIKSSTIGCQTHTHTPTRNEEIVEERTAKHSFSLRTSGNSISPDDDDDPLKERPTQSQSVAGWSVGQLMKCVSVASSERFVCRWS